MSPRRRKLLGSLGMFFSIDVLIASLLSLIFMWLASQRQAMCSETYLALVRKPLGRPSPDANLILNCVLHRLFTLHRVISPEGGPAPDHMLAAVVLVRG